MSINWNYPTSIWFGEKRIREIQKACDSLNIKNPLIVTDPGILKTNIMWNYLTYAFCNINSFSLSQI